MMFTSVIKELGVTGPVPLRCHTHYYGCHWIFLGIESLNWIQITGILIVVTGVILSQLRSRRS